MYSFNFRVVGVEFNMLNKDIKGGEAVLLVS